MHRWVTALFVPLIWLPLIFGGVGAEPPTETVTVSMVIWEANRSDTVFAPGVTCTLHKFGDGWAVLDAAVTDDYGRCELTGEFPLDSFVGVWVERTDNGGYFQLPISKRCAGYVPVSVGTNWRVTMRYDHDGYYWDPDWRQLPPPR